MDRDIVAELINDQEGYLRQVLELFRPEYKAAQRLKNDPGVKYRFEKLLAAVKRLPNPVRIKILELTHYELYRIWKCSAEMPVELQKLLNVGPLTFSQYVFEEKSAG